MKHWINYKSVIAIVCLLTVFFNTASAADKNGKCTKEYPCCDTITIPLHHSETILISAKQFFSYMSVSVKKGEVYNFRVVGQQNYKDWTVATTADGWDNKMLEWKIARNGKRLKTARCYELSAIIGVDTNSMFAIGKQLDRYSAISDGNLRFFVNDHKRFYWNNKGFLLLKITRVQ